MVGAKGVGVDCMLAEEVDELEGFEVMDGDEETDTVPLRVPVLSSEGEVEVVEVVEGQGETVAPKLGEGVESEEREAR